MFQSYTIALSSLALLLSAFSQAQAGPPPPDGHRFRWIEEVETLVQRQIPDQLSQPLNLRPVDVPLPDRRFDVTAQGDYACGGIKGTLPASPTWTLQPCESLNAPRGTGNRSPLRGASDVKLV